MTFPGFLLGGFYCKCLKRWLSVQKRVYDREKCSLCGKCVQVGENIL